MGGASEVLSSVAMIRRMLNGLRIRSEPFQPSSEMVRRLFALLSSAAALAAPPFHLR